MGIADTKDGKLLYHLTRLSNLDSILKNNLLPRNVMIEENLLFFDIADKDIISKRTQLGLDIYTPFHFHPYTSFDVAVKNKYIDEKFIYICIKREFARNNEFKILPRHPLNLEECTLMDYDEGFNEIDWDTMHCKGRCDDYAKKVKMAECLTNQTIFAESFHCICVEDYETKILVENCLKENGVNKKPPYIDIKNWF